MHDVTTLSLVVHFDDLAKLLSPLLFDELLQLRLLVFLQPHVLPQSMIDLGLVQCRSGSLMRFQARGGSELPLPGVVAFVGERVLAPLLDIDADLLYHRGP